MNQGKETIDRGRQRQIEREKTERKREGDLHKQRMN